ncbi:rhomboid family intramembrane serine protease [uncultured Psychroserpens sp.]|uniref:rhomboid family intramembrane serine protease n=1 Tax=uncultured Psychroserpens sp. TaxID=255436 RepID=UPI00262467F7|nr:rhomboid family intramembrane serine protease [uncultured Psychroserpens sp.]
MRELGIASIILIIANVAISYRGFKNRTFFESYKFEVDKILIQKDYIRLVSSGFLHTSWRHLIFNLISLYAFSGMLEMQLGIWSYLLIYFVSLIGGDLLALFIHRNHGDYSAVGASGAVCGIIFASIALFPGLDIGFFGIPLAIPNWIFGVLYVIYSIYGITSAKDNIGHEAHLGGALIGMLVAITIRPEALVNNYIIITMIAIPIILFIYIIVRKPHILFINNLYFKSKSHNLTIDQRYNETKVFKQKEIDKLLDKISRKGIGSLSKKEKEKLDNYSK